MTQHATDTNHGRLPALLLILILLLSTHPSFSQHSRTIFDVSSILEFPYSISLLARGDVNGDGRPDLVTSGRARLSVSIQGKTAFDWTRHSVRTRTTPVLLATGRINADNRDDIACYSVNPSTVRIYLSSSGGIPRFHDSIALTQEYGKLMIADIDGDANADIILFGKKTLGITVLRGDGRGDFSDETVILADTPVSLLSVLHLDDDDIPDLIVTNWVRNIVAVYSGFGGLNFSDPATWRFQHEPLAVSAGDLNADGIRDLLVGFGEEPGYEILNGDAAGDFTLSGTRALPGPPSKLRIGDANGDGRNDILFTSREGGIVGVGIGTDDSIGFQMRSYFIGRGSSDVIFFQDRRKRGLNCAVVYEGERELRIVHSRTADLPDRTGYTLVTGRDPSDLLLLDANNDGRTDAIVTQGTDPVMNVYLNGGRGTLSGMFSIPLPEKAQKVIPVGGRPEPPEIIGVGYASGSFNCTFLSMVNFNAVLVRLPGGPLWEVLHSEFLRPTDLKRIYVLRRDDADEAGTLLSYDIRADRPVEESELTHGLPGGLNSALVHDFNRDGRSDLVTLSVPDSSGEFILSIFRQDSLGFNPIGSTSFPVLTEKPLRCALWGSDLNDDGEDDLIINFPNPINSLFVAYALGDSSFSPPEFTLGDVQVGHGTHMLIATDFDRDGRTDIVLLNERTSTIQFFPGTGKGEFDRPVNLSSGRGVRALAVADLDADGENELVVLDEEHGLSVTSFHHPLYSRSPTNGSR